MTRTRFALAAAASLAILAAAGGVDGVGAATIATDVLTDDDTVNGNCSFREAARAAALNAAVDACTAGEAPPVVDRIVLQAGSYTLNSRIQFGEDVEIEGAGQAATDLSGPTTSGLIGISGVPGPTVSIHDLTLRDADSTTDGGCIEHRSGVLTVTDCTFDTCSAAARGGAIFSSGGELHLVRVTLRDNTAGTDGGAVSSFISPTTVTDSTVIDNRTDPPTGSRQGGGLHQNTGTMTVIRTLVRGNEASLGGGISISAADVTLTDVTLDRNVATNGGGGLRQTGTNADVTLTRTTISHNRSNRGGGARVSNGVLRLIDSTVSGNTANEGGGIYSDLQGDVELTHATVAHDSAPAGPALVSLGDLTVANSLLAGGCVLGVTPATSLGGNLESPGDTCGLDDPSDQTNVADPAITAVADHGGLTETVLLLPGSPAIDAALAGDCTAEDQRGNPRPLDGDGVGGADCDVGAVEVVQGETAPLFEDGFESGDTLAWTLSVP